MMKTAEFIQGKGYVVAVSRTSRTKTASLTVEQGDVMLVVPKELTSDRIEKIIQGRHTWIIKKIASHLEATPATKKQYVSGEAFPYLGRNYRLKVIKGEYQAAKLINGRLQIGLAESAIQEHFARGALVHWYKRNAQRKLREKAERYAKIVGVTLASIHIKSFKTRWGSCTPKGDLDFNWVIVMAPNRIVDYVVVHELCHLIHMDHSFKFWLEVERVMPDYKECREWLKVNGHTLVV
jgi:predicted metal-dependent hydrolase